VRERLTTKRQADEQRQCGEWREKLTAKKRKKRKKWRKRAGESAEECKLRQDEE